MEEGKYRAGIIGCGRIGSGLDDPWFDEHVRDESWRLRPCTHAGVFAAHPRVELAAGADTHAGRLAAFSRCWGVERVYQDYHQMLQEEDLDIVSVATASPLHAEMTIAAARAGVKAVLCEKPIACSLSEADAMIDACEQHGTRLIVNHTFRLSPSLQLARRMVEEGAIGELQTMTCYCSRWLLHMGSHLFDLMCMFAGEPESVCGLIVGDDTVDADGSGYVRFKSGIVGLFDFRPKVAAGYLELMGAGGLLRLCDDSDCTMELWLPASGAEAHINLPPESHRFPGLPPHLADSVPRRGRFVTRFTVDETIDCIEDCRESISSGRDARWALEIALGVYGSHRSGGRPIDLPFSDRSLWMPESRPFEYPAG